MRICPPARRILVLGLLFAALPAQTPVEKPAFSPRELSGYLPVKTPLVVDLFDGAVCVQNALALLEPLPRALPAEARAVFMAVADLARAG